MRSLGLLQCYHPNDSWALEGAFNNHQTDSAGTDPSGAGLVTTEAPKHGANISANKSLPPVLVGMDKAENAGQFSAAVGAITALNRMMALGADQKGFRGHSNHHHRR